MVASTEPRTPAELSYLVATEVMGWTLHSDGNWLVPGDTPGEWVRAIPEFQWTPDRSISDAWEVVEEMRRRGWWVDIGSAADRGWEAKFERNNPRDFDEASLGYTFAPTAPLAICLAALAAVGVSVRLRQEEGDG